MNEINDFFTSTGDTVSELCFIKAYNPDNFPFANKDLVGEPLLDGIWGGDYFVLSEEELRELQEKNSRTITENIGETGEVVITEGNVKDIVIPDDMTKSAKVTAPLAPETTISTEGSKSITITNTSNEAVEELSIDAPNVSTVYFTGGTYENVETNTSFKVTEGSVGNVVISDEVDKNITINAALSEDSTVESGTDKAITITNSNDNANVNIETPNASVTVNGSYDQVSSNVSDTTLTVGQTVHIKKLVVKKGNVVVKDFDVNNRIDEVVNDTEYTVLPLTQEANDWTTFNRAATTPGITEVTADIEKSGSSITFGVVASGNYKWNLNGHTITCGTRTGSVLTRGSVKLTIDGGGTINNSSNNYGIWCSGNNSVINLYDVKVNAATHAVYCERGEINIYGGEYKISNEDKTFLVNCTDANYTDGTARINIYGGTFYGWNPAASLSEPGGPVSFVAEGYEVQEVEENVFKVVKSE